MKNIDKIQKMDSFELSYFINNLYKEDNEDGDSQCFNKCKEYDVVCGARCRKNLQEYFESEVIE